MSELIYKQDAIEAIYATFAKSLARQKAIEAVESCKAVKVVEPERKRGHWIVRNEYSMRPILCSECGEWQSSLSFFCPECGADMRGEEDG